jgi:hypothetical protein
VQQLAPPVLFKNERQLDEKTTLPLPSRWRTTPTVVVNFNYHSQNQFCDVNRRCRYERATPPNAPKMRIDTDFAFSS